MNRTRMIVDIPEAIQMAIRLRGVKDDKTTGEIVAAAMRAAFPDDVEQAESIISERAGMEKP